MSYLEQSRRPSPASMVAVVGIHAGIGVALITGLTISGVIAERDGPLVTIDPYDPPPPPPPPPTPKPQPQPRDETMPDIFVPRPDLDLTPPKPFELPTTDVIPTPRPDIIAGNGTSPLPDPIPSATFTPTAARPKNNPGSWLSDSDYRPMWIRQELSGTAKFRLDIASNGRVSACRVIGSTGHEALDAATCDLVSKRARFEPARGRDGEAVGGSYTGSVLWKLPE